MSEHNKVSETRSRAAQPCERSGVTFCAPNWQKNTRLYSVEYNRVNTQPYISINQVSSVGEKDHLLKTQLLL